MSSIWLISAIGASLLWGITNALDEVLRKRFIRDDLLLLWLLGIFHFVVSIILFLSFYNEISFDSKSLKMMGVGLLWAPPIYFYFKALEIEEASRVALLMQTVPLFTLIFANILGVDSLSYIQLLAFALLMMGGVLASVKRIEKKWKLSMALLWIVIANIMWSISDVLFREYSHDFSSFWGAFVPYFAGSSLLVFLVPLLRKNFLLKTAELLYSLESRAWHFWGMSNLLSIMGVIVFAYALRLGPASLTSVLAGMQPLFAFLTSFFFLKQYQEIDEQRKKPDNIILKLLSFILIILGLLVLSMK